MKLRALQNFYYDHREFKRGDIIEAQSAFDAMVLCNELNPQAEYIAEESEVKPRRGRPPRRNQVASHDENDSSEAVQLPQAGSETRRRV